MTRGRVTSRAVARRQRLGYTVAKRVLDLVGAAVLLVLLSPLLALVALLVRAGSTGPALFRQTRVGRDGRPFTMVKFRTMKTGCSDVLHREYVKRLLEEDTAVATPATPVFKLDDDPRLTSLGKLLRRTSIDELPQLFNVLRGDMSLVGPRPVLPWERELLRGEYDDRFSVPPGMTGLWQTSGRSTLTMRQALELDLQYVRRCGFLLDLRLLLLTVRTVLRVGDAG
ncbi:sugar transferase [Pedococcus ginsenosidimutans]|uniref:sugar transferase n=1 Tax=Pedococcus ginsenosidimutans TaxID=490570 RepID=UPI0031F17EDF